MTPSLLTKGLHLFMQERGKGDQHYRLCQEVIRQVGSYINGVAKKHREVSRLMFAGHTIDAITNGAHAAT
ncbi:MAG: hypothetical protein A2W09_01830 [Deltaproteobacteria bacterium RBG_16_50_11]|nr:MAG: hypothetical protein A2W09_01830 [Deltaproteobacteria bacterium RBG_16_50_11]